MHANFFKPLWAYLKSRLPWAGKGGQIYNQLQLTDKLATSGQPTLDQFVQIQQAGYQTVINLAPSHAENAIENEADIVTRLGMHYVHIPVDFKQPSAEDFEHFCQAMLQATTQKVWVHCAANMRVSAFVYKYRRDVLEEDEARIRRDLHLIWQPYGVWKQFIGR